MAGKRCAVFIVQGSKTGTGRPEQPLLFFSLIHITHHTSHHTHPQKEQRRKKERERHRESKGSQEKE